MERLYKNKDQAFVNLFIAVFTAVMLGFSIVASIYISESQQTARIYEAGRIQANISSR